MFIGHFALGFAAKRIAPRTSLGTLLAAPELADIAAPGFDRQVISKFAALGQRCLDL